MDPQSLVLIRREVELEDGITVTEEYTATRFDANVPDSAFKLPDEGQK